MVLILLILLILILPIGIIIKHDEKTKIKLKIWFLSFDLSPKNKSDENEKNNDSDLDSKENKGNKFSFGKMIKKNGLLGSVKFVYKLICVSLKTLKKLLRHVKIKELDLNIEITGEDAAKTAVKYGQVSSVVYGVLGIITSATTPKNYSVSIKPNFLETKDRLRFKLNVYTTMFFVILTVAHFVKCYAKIKE